METRPPATRPAGSRPGVPRVKTLIPVLSVRHQRRERLLALLDTGGPGQVTVVSAPAGYGKTQLLAEWAGARAEPAAWVSLDEDDNDDRRFWAAVLTAIGSCAGPASEVHGLVVPAAPSGDPEFLAPRQSRRARAGRRRLSAGAAGPPGRSPAPRSGPTRR